MLKVYCHHLESRNRAEDWKRTITQSDLTEKLEIKSYLDKMYWILFKLNGKCRRRNNSAKQHASWLSFR